jgi:hypothetical protein
MMPTAFVPWSSASDWKKWSTKKPRQHPVRGDHVDVVELDLHLMADLDHLHGGVLREQFHHETLMRGIQVLDENERHAVRHGHARQETAERIEPTRRRSDGDDENARLDRSCRCGRRLLGRPGRVFEFPAARGPWRGGRGAATLQFSEGFRPAMSHEGLQRIQPASCSAHNPLGSVDPWSAPQGQLLGA